MAGALHIDRTAWDALVAQYGHRVKVALLGDGHRLDVASDLAQEAWALLWSKHQRGELLELQLPGLAITQARFLAKDLRRRDRRENEKVISITPAVAADDRLATAQQLHRVRLALAARSLQQQRIFSAAIDEQRPHGDIANDEKLSLQRVRQIIWEVRKALRSALEDT